MLNQMLVVIRGMKDLDKLGRLQGAVLARICDVTETDPVTHLENAIKSIREALSHEEADVYAQAVLEPLVPGRETLETAYEKRQAIRRFERLYPSWDRSRSALDLPPRR